MKAMHTSAQRLGITAIAVAVLTFGFWMWLAPLHGAVVTAGLVKTATNRKFVQHTDGGIIKRIHVHNGDSVREGQTLVELEDVKVDANYQLLMELAVFEAIKRDRLDAEQQLASRFEPSPERRKTFDPALVDKAHQRELKIFRIRRALLDEQLASYQRQLLAVGEEQTALRRQMDSSRQAAQLARDELGLNEALVRDKFISRARLITLERTVAEYGAKQGEHEAMLAQSEQRRNDMALRMAFNPQRVPAYRRRGIQGEQRPSRAVARATAPSGRRRPPQVRRRTGVRQGGWPAAQYAR